MKRWCAGCIRNAASFRRAEFIPIAEETDLIVEIGEWVLREACREAACWKAPLQVAVNVSAIQFRRGNLQQLVGDVLRETGISPARLELEITEGVLIENVERATLMLQRPQEARRQHRAGRFRNRILLAVLSAMRSRSTGSRSTASFVASLGRTDRSLAIVRAVIGLAHGLGLPVLAEGVRDQ